MSDASRPSTPWMAVLVLLTAGCVARVWISTQCHLNPDEALHFNRSNHETLLETYLESRVEAHPPLFFLLLHVWRAWGTSEVALRSLSVAAGTIALWGAYRWMTRIAGGQTALIGLGMLAFAPMMISLATEVRHYALLFCFEMFALTAVEDALSSGSRRAIGRFAVWQSLALLTHYSAVWVLLTIAIYGTCRLLTTRRDWRLLASWAAALSVAGLVAGWLLWSHVSQLRGSALEQKAQDEWLRAYYFHSSDETLPRFLMRNLLGIFMLLSGMLPRGDQTLNLCFVLAGVFAFSLVNLLIKGRPANGTEVASHHGPGAAAITLLLTLPIAIAAAAGALRLFPFGATRHIAYILPFVAAGVSLLPGQLLRARPWMIAAGWLVAGPVWMWSTTTPGPHNTPLFHRREFMTQALDDIRATIDRQQPLFMDGQTFQVMSYYLNRGRPTPLRPLADGYAETELDGRRAFIAESEWSFSAADFPAQLARLKRAAPALQGGTVCVIGQSWGYFYGDFVEQLPADLCRSPKKFGEGLVVFQSPL